MLGDQLLVAPVFEESGEVTYYLPEGDWYHLLTGEKIRGGCWRKEHHGFLSLPLLVRGGTVLPMGACDNRTDYDFTDGVELRAYGLQPGQTCCLEIPSLSGALDTRYAVTRTEDGLRVETTAAAPWHAGIYEG